MPWREAWKDPDQLKEAAKTGAKGVAVVGGVAMIAAVAAKSGVLKKGINVLKALK